MFKVQRLKDYLQITLGIMITCFGWVMFLLPNHIPVGGIAGISSVVNWAFGIPVSITYLLLNVILLVFALRILGWDFCLKTIYSVFVFTGVTALYQYFLADVHLLQGQLFMSIIIGACLFGSGVGLVLLANGSSGGTDLVAMMVHKNHDVSLGHVILITDLTIISSSYLVLMDINRIIYGIVGMFIIAFSVDYVVNTLRRSVQFFIISEKYKEIGNRINHEVKRGCTEMDATGFYSRKGVKMLFVIAKREDSSKIFEVINEIDPKAFVSQSAVIGVFGEGFDRIKK